MLNPRFVFVCCSPLLPHGSRSMHHYAFVPTATAICSYLHYLPPLPACVHSLDATRKEDSRLGPVAIANNHLSRRIC
uniref:Putative secreted peptide n=1 Tax=Anopheles braziliensis TaxID=58242 RepID=A0A2M3ZS70_9DIPT